MDIVRASSSLPFVSPVTYVDCIPMLDGGIADSIPVEYALSQGYERLVVVLTRNKGYRKKDTKMRAAKVIYKKYPNLLHLVNRHCHDSDTKRTTLNRKHPIKGVPIVKKRPAVLTNSRS